MLPLQGAWVQSLLGELGAHQLHSTSKKKDVLSMDMYEFYSAMKKEIMHLQQHGCVGCDRESVILSEVSQTEEEKYRMTSLICRI